MNKEQYQQIMNRIQMPDASAQHILSQIESGTIAHHRSPRRIVLSAVAAVACAGIIGMASVSALQPNWVQQLFPNAEESAIEQYATANADSISAFSADLDGIDAELVAAFADDSTLYYVLRLTLQEDFQKDSNIALDPEHFAIANTGNNWLNKTSSLLEESGQGATTQDGDAYLFTCRQSFQTGSLETGMVYQTELHAYQYGDTKDDFYEFGTIGTVSFTLDLEKTAKTVSYQASGRWSNAQGYFEVETASLQALTLTLQGVADEQTNVATNVSVLLEDGSSIPCTVATYGYRNGGRYTETMTDIEQFFYLDQPIDPATTVAIQMDDVTISLTPATC